MVLNYTSASFAAIFELLCFCTMRQNANLSCGNAQIIQQVKATANKPNILGYTAHKKVHSGELFKNNGHASKGKCEKVEARLF